MFILLISAFSGLRFCCVDIFFACLFIFTLISTVSLTLQEMLARHLLLLEIVRFRFIPRFPTASQKRHARTYGGGTCGQALPAPTPASLPVTAVGCDLTSSLPLGVPLGLSLSQTGQTCSMQHRHGADP